MSKDDTIAIAHPKAAKSTKSKTTAKRRGATSSSTTSPTTAASTHWEGDGLRIPLFHPDGRKRQRARQASTLISKSSRNQLLEIVREYAGDVVYERLKGWKTAVEIAKWIEGAETKALGPPRGKKDVVLPQTRTHDDAIQGVVVPMPNQSDYGHAASLVVKHDSTMGKRNANGPAKSCVPLDPRFTHDKAQSAQQSAVQTYSAVARPQPRKQQPAPQVEKDIFDRTVLDMYKASTIEERHPLIDILGLDPSDSINHTVVIDLPQTQERVVITATSLTTVIQTYVPMNSSPPYAHRYLKKGPHGWDHEKNRWYFYDDQDLDTGVGHQVEPEDEVRLEDDLTFRIEFDKKYVGLGVSGQWPCGCPKPQDDDESEEE